MGNNIEIETAAKVAVEQYEKNRGRNVVEGSGGKGHGFDLMTIGNGETRIIEIKSTNKPYLAARWLEPLEYQKMRTSDNYWVYAVLDTDTSPRIRTFTRDQWMDHFDREEIKYWYKFSRTEFNEAETP